MKRPYTEELEKATKKESETSLQGTQQRATKIQRLRESYCQRSAVDRNTLKRVRKTPNKLINNRAKLGAQSYFELKPHKTESISFE